MTDIDYEALAQVLIETPGDETQTIPRKYWAPTARAVVAALRDQGLVVASKKDIDTACYYMAHAVSVDDTKVKIPSDYEAFWRLLALAAPTPDDPPKPHDPPTAPESP